MFNSLFIGFLGILIIVMDVARRYERKQLCKKYDDKCAECLELQEIIRTQEIKETIRKIGYL